MAKKSLFVFILAVIAIAVFTGINLWYNQPLFPIKQDGKWGLMDKRGQVIVKPQFTNIHYWAGGLTGVEIDKKWGFIDRRGKLVIPVQFDAVGLFSEGLAPFSRDGKYGYINKKGKVVIQPTYFLAYEFHDGRAVVWANADQYGYIDRQGKTLIEPKLSRGFILEYKFAGHSSYNFSDGLACIYLEKDGKYSFIDKQGNVKDWRFYLALPFSEGLAPVAKEMGKGFKVGYIDTKGNLVIDYKFDVAFPFSQGLAPAWLDDKFFYIDKTGKKVFEVNADGGSVFSEGLAKVRTGDKCGYIDRTGKLVIPQRFYNSDELYDYHDYFKNGLASASQVEAGRWTHGYIDKTGKYVYSYSE